MKIQKFAKKNITLLLLAGAAIVTMIVLLTVLFTGSSEPIKDSSQVANESSQGNNSQNEVNDTSLAQEENASVFQNTGPYSCSFKGGECRLNTDEGYPPVPCSLVSGGTCADGSSCCAIGGEPGPIEGPPPQDPIQGPTTCATNGSQCIGTGGISSCSDIGSGWAEGSGTCLSNQICCTEVSSTTCSVLGGNCQDQNQACGAEYYNTVDCPYDQGKLCCVGKADDFTGPSPTPSIAYGQATSTPDQNTGSPGENGVPGMEADDPLNFCPTKVKCGDCNEKCTYGSGKCQTCATEDNSCSFSQACSSDTQNPIFENTCGGGNFLDASKQQRSFDEVKFGDRYKHVICPGFSTCEGGPNADGLFWCIEVGNAPEPTEDIVTCDVATDYNKDNSCSSGCAQWNYCTDDSYEKISCVDKSFCDVNTPTTAPTQPPSSDPSDPVNAADYPSVNTIGNFTSGGTIYTDSKIKIKVQGDGIHKFYIHGDSTPKENDDVVQSYNKNSISANKFYALGQSSLKEISFDAPTEPGKYYVVANAFKDHPNGELVCSWAQKLFQRKPDGSIDLNDVLDDCNNASWKLGAIFSITVQEPQAATNPDPTQESDTSSDVKGLKVTATTSLNCGGDVLVTWTKPTSNAYPWEYYLYISDSPNFEPKSTNIAPGSFPLKSPMQNPPFHDWEAPAGKKRYYQVWAYDGGNGNNTVKSNEASVTASSACGN